MSRGWPKRRRWPSPRAPDEIVLAGDTTVAVGRRILEKPRDEADLRRMLGLLSGRRHHVYSGVCVIGAGRQPRTRVVDTLVGFKPLSAAEIDWYVASGEGMGKAGGYAIQGRAEGFVRYLAGSHSNVVGLPVFETLAMLRSAGLAAWLSGCTRQGSARRARPCRRRRGSSKRASSGRADCGSDGVRGAAGRSRRGGPVASRGAMRARR